MLIFLMAVVAGGILGVVIMCLRKAGKPEWTAWVAYCLLAATVTLLLAFLQIFLLHEVLGRVNDFGKDGYEHWMVTVWLCLEWARRAIVYVNGFLAPAMVFYHLRNKETRKRSLVWIFIYVQTALWSLLDLWYCI